MKAFPTPTISVSEEARITSIGGEGGMDLRDYFAARAMAADMTDGIHENDFAWAAARAYKVADAMLKAREQK